MTIVLATENETEIGSATGAMEDGMTATVTTVPSEIVQTGIGTMTDGILGAVDLARGRPTGHTDLKRRTDVRSVIVIDVLVLGRGNGLWIGIIRTSDGVWTEAPTVPEDLVFALLRCMCKTKGFHLF